MYHFAILETAGALSTEVEPGPLQKEVLPDRISGDTVDDMGIPRNVEREWALIVARADLIASNADETLVPASRFRDLERQIESLKRQVDRQSLTIQVLKRKGIL